MAGDQKAVEQTSIKLMYQGEGAFRTVRDVHVPEPPDGCESQQLFDWATLVIIVGNTNMPMYGKMRLVQAYCERHPSVTTEEYTGPWPPPPTQQRQ